MKTIAVIDIENPIDQIEEGRLNTYMAKQHPLCAPVGEVNKEAPLKLFVMDFDPNDVPELETNFPHEVFAKLTGACLAKDCYLRSTQQCPLTNRNQVLIY